jgi:hypothetical protein
MRGSNRKLLTRCESLRVAGALFWAASCGWFDGEIWGGVLQKSGSPGVYAWETERLPEEPWPTFVARASGQALLAIQAAPAALREDEVSVPSNAKAYYNLTWTGRRRLTTCNERSNRPFERTGASRAAQRAR